MKIDRADTLSLRYERKFMMHMRDIASAVAIVKTNGGLFSESYEERRINSIYFDTDDYSYYMDNAVGKAERYKVRFRWYGDDIGNISKGNIEVKSKNGYLGSKAIFKLGDFETSYFLENYRMVINNSDIDVLYKKLFSFLRPVILVSYSRKYYVSADKNYRITLDYNVKFYDLRTGANLLKKVDSELSVLELKYTYENDDLVRKISSQIPYRYSKSSKYGIGLESL